MRQVLIIISFTLIVQFSLGQYNTCDCPTKSFNQSGKPDKTFSFKNGTTIGLCGFIEQEGMDTTYSEFIIFECGQVKILKQWDATQSCKISTKNDTLFIHELYVLAIDKNLQTKLVPFYTTKYYFDNSSLRSTSFFRNDLPKYSTTQVETAIKQYDLLTNQTSGDSTLLVAHRLFWAYVSGSKEAEKLLESFEKRFGPFDGAIAEEFHDLWATYQLYKP